VLTSKMGFLQTALEACDKWHCLSESNCHADFVHIAVLATK